MIDNSKEIMKPGSIVKLAQASVITITEQFGFTAGK
jgi:hypothetical protein